MKIAVIGSGISGLGASLLLSQKFDVHLFETQKRLGGHAHTVSVSDRGQEVPIDTGFLVYNTLNYPHLTAMFDYLGVETVVSDMSLAIRLERQNLEWSGTNLNAVFAQRKNIFRPSFYKMLNAILRFHNEATANLAWARENRWTLGELLHARGFPPVFVHQYILPMGAAIWSMPERDMLNFPAETFLAFFLNHRLLQVNGRPQWRTVRNGSARYVHKIASRLSNIHFNTAVTRVQRTDDGVWVRTETGEGFFDRVVMATHAPVTARLLEFIDEHEERTFRAFAVESNRALLHRDESAMPQRRRAWSSWNVHGAHGEPSPEEKVSLTYYLNRLQPLGDVSNFFVSLNPRRSYNGVERELHYDHPVFDFAAIEAQKNLPRLQGRGGVYFAGAWTRYGFHEDGLQSAVNVARLMGVDTPWSV